MDQIVLAMVVAGIKAAHEAGDAACIVDMTRTFDAVQAHAAGMDTDRLLFSTPDNAEQAGEIIVSLARSGAVRLLIALGDVGDISHAAPIAGRTEMRIVRL